MDSRAPEVAQLTDILTAKLEASQEIIPNMHSLMLILQPLRTLKSPTPTAKRFWAALASAIKRSSFTPSATDLILAYFKMRTVPSYEPEVRQLFLAIAGIAKPITPPKPHDTFHSLFYPLASGKERKNVR